VDRGRRLDVAWERLAPSLPPRDRSWVQEVAFGTLRLRGRLDHLLDRHLHRGVSSLPEPLLRILRIGAYQLTEMGGVPGYAAVSESVALARGVAGAKGAGLVNAVLRSMAREDGADSGFPTLEMDPAGYLSTWGSHPRWLVERWLAHYGVSDTKRIVAAGNEIPRIFLRPIGIDLEVALLRLAEAGVEAEAGPPATGTVLLPRGVDPTEVLRLIPAIVQDPAAAAVVERVPLRGGERVADLCAAPGGKGIALGGRGATVFLADPSFVRLRRVRSTIERLGIPERLVVARGEYPPFRPVDLVLVDAPCSGTGTLSRHPDARWRLAPSDPAKLAEVQLRILEGARSAVRPGGWLLYSTCTLEVEENEGVVEEFLRRAGEFELDGEGAILRVLPGEGSTDGAFAARMRRRR